MKQSCKPKYFQKRNPQEMKKNKMKQKKKPKSASKILFIHEIHKMHISQ